jgi:hypothetical protein
MATITGHQLQFRPTIRHAWRIIHSSNNPIMAPCLDVMPELVRRNGYGLYQIVTILSDGRWSVPFEAMLTADSNTMSRELSPDERAELHGTDPAAEWASEQEYIDEHVGSA